MNERFKLVLVKLVCVDVDAPNFTKYNFKKNYLAIKDTEDELQPYGIINGFVDMANILMEIKESNKLGRATMGLCFCGEYDKVAWELEHDYKFKEVE